jgi:predicted secreted protein
MSIRGRYVALVLGLVTSATALPQDIDAEASAVWQKVRADLFSGLPIAVADDVPVLEAPKRAEDAAAVPLAVRAQFLPESDPIHRKAVADHRSLLSTTRGPLQSCCSIWCVAGWRL